MCRENLAWSVDWLGRGLPEISRPLRRGVGPKLRSLLPSLTFSNVPSPRLARANKLLADDNKRFQKVAPILPPNPRPMPNATGHVSGGLTSSAPEELSSHIPPGPLERARHYWRGSELA